MLLLIVQDIPRLRERLGNGNGYFPKFFRLQPSIPSRAKLPDTALMATANGRGMGEGVPGPGRVGGRGVPVAGGRRTAAPDLVYATRLPWTIPGI